MAPCRILKCALKGCFLSNRPAVRRRLRSRPAWVFCLLACLAGRHLDHESRERLGAEGRATGLIGTWFMQADHNAEPGSAVADMMA